MSSSTNAAPVDILLVEDNPAEVRLTRRILDDARVLSKLHVAEDGLAAMRFLNRTGEYADAPRPDLSLLDLNLPKKDGREVLAAVKGDPEFKSIPVVVMTSSEAPRDILRSYELQANCYIIKPIDLDSFVSALKSFEDFWLNVVRLPREEEPPGRA